jgi:hypothetical protein
MDRDQPIDHRLLRAKTRAMSTCGDATMLPNASPWRMKSATLALQISFLLGRQLVLGH